MNSYNPSLELCSPPPRLSHAHLCMTFHLHNPHSTPVGIIINTPPPHKVTSSRPAIMFSPTPASPLPIYAWPFICIPPGPPDPPSIPLPIYGLDLRGALPSLKYKLQLMNGRHKKASPACEVCRRRPHLTRNRYSLQNEVLEVNADHSSPEVNGKGCATCINSNDGAKIGPNRNTFCRLSPKPVDLLL